MPPRPHWGTPTPLYAEALKNMAYLYIDYQKEAKAQEMLDQACAIWDEKFGRTNVHSAEVMALYGDLAMQQKKYEPALEYYEESLKSYGRLFSDEHPEYVYIKGKMAKAHYSSKNYDDAADLLEETTEIYVQYIKRYFPALSEREKQKFWLKIKDDFELLDNLAVRRGAADGDLIEKMFNYSLATKAILLSISSKLKKRVLESGDEQLIALYEQWVEKKELLSNAAGMSNDQLKNAELDIGDLEDQIERLETQLSKSIELFGESQMIQADWKDIQDQLKEGQVALDIVKMRHYEEGFTDSIIYVALLVTPETRKQPKMIVLKEGRALEEKFFHYYRNAMKYGLKDEVSYQAFWAAIEKEIPDSATVFLSADGVYNQLNPETLYNPDTKEYMLNHHDFVLVSKLKRLLESQTNKESGTEKPKALLLGNPKYYSGRVEGNRVPQLQGAEKEVEMIHSKLDQAGYEVASFIYAQAEEEVIRTSENPDILHIATHGFFLPDSKGAAKQSLLKGQQLLDNPLFRSGIILKNGGHFVLNDTRMRPEYTQEPGVLTAYEAMNLHLDHTDLVVLSACETGVGEVQAGEGVYGLQRSFIVAGARYLVMSLFKVSDEATSQLMQHFYDQVLAGKDYRRALRQAKLELKKDYPEPIYWGAFNLIGY